MSDLGAAIEGFLEADGFQVTARHDTSLVVERMVEDRRERRRIWCADPAAGFKFDETALLAEFEAAGRTPGESLQSFLVVPSLAGVSTRFRERSAKLGVGIRVPVQFFDTPYKADADAAFGTGGGEQARSVFADFVRQHARVAASRVPQPFMALSALGGGQGGFGSGVDLGDNLLGELSTPHDGPRLTIVLGRAGAGKSILFAALFSRLHEHFAAEKRAQRQASRPILFLPAHIRDRQVRSLDGLLDAVARTDAAAATNPRLMRWLNATGRTTWMFDGLDEFFAGEGDFVAALDAVLAGDGRSDILICTRDSLLTSSTALRQLIDRHLTGGRIRLYELARWERPSQRALAHLRLAGRPLADADAVDPPKVAAFLASLDQSPGLAELATLPYYCDLLAGLAARGKSAPNNELDLLAAAVDGLIDREAEKLAGGETGFGWDVFSGAETFVEANELVEAMGVATFNVAQEREQLLAVMAQIGRNRLVELIEGIAHLMRMTEPYPNESRGLSIGELESYGRFYLDVGLIPDMEPRVLLALVQLAFFAPGGGVGHVRFAHEIVADFLAARHAMGVIRARPDNADGLGQALGVRADLERSVFLRYLVRELNQDLELAGAVLAHVEAGRVRPAHAANAALLAAALARGAA